MLFYVSTNVTILLLQDIIVNFLLATGLGCAGILGAYMASLWAQAPVDIPAEVLARVTAALAVSCVITLLSPSVAVV